MRWFWIDRFTELISGKSATAIKAISFGEQQLHDHFPGYPMMPNSLVIEGMAQTGGLLVSEYNDFAERVILAKLARSTFHFHAVPGDVLTYRATIQLIRCDGAMVTVTSHVGPRLQAEAEIYFAHLDTRSDHRELYDPHDFYLWLQILKVFEVGRKSDGSRLQVPPHLAESHRQHDPSPTDPAASRSASREVGSPAR
jgi:3-hydroxyacyl-[acyl-carrier-protein] dehydratase